jgi:uncharacterized Tic20 family protein
MACDVFYKYKTVVLNYSVHLIQKQFSTTSPQFQMKTITLTLNIILLISLIPSFLLAITSPMIFGAGANKRLWWTLWTALALPVLIIITQFICWKAYNNQNYGFALKVSLIPILNWILLIFFMLRMDNGVR